MALKRHDLYCFAVYLWITKMKKLNPAQKRTVTKTINDAFFEAEEPSSQKDFAGTVQPSSDEA